MDVYLKHWRFPALVAYVKSISKETKKRLDKIPEMFIVFVIKVSTETGEGLL